MAELGEGGDSALDLAGVANADWAHLDPERLRRSLDGAELSDPGGIVGIAEHGRARHARRDLLEQFEPFRRSNSYSKMHEAGDVAARPGQALDEAGADRIGDAHEHNRHSCGSHCCSAAIAESAIGQDDVTARAATNSAA